MRILLIYPTPPASVWPKGRFRSRWIPSGVAQIAAQLQLAGHETRVCVREEQLVKANLNWAAADDHLRRLLMEFRPEIVGLSVVTPAVDECANLARRIRELLGEDVLLVAGGHHPSALPEQTLEHCPNLDAVAIGEGEQTMVELAERGCDETVAGLAFRRDGEIVRTARRAVWADLDALEPIPYDLFDMDYYAARDRWLIRWLNLRAINLRTSRGCPNRCTFCAGYVTAGVGVRFHSPEYVLERMAWAIERLGVEAILFEDETLAADPERLLTLCEGIRRRGWHKKICWSGCLRVAQADTEILAAMKAAGCVQIEYGFETGSDRMLKKLNKNASVEQNRRAARLTREAGMRVYADIMVGLPGETAEDFHATIDFLRWAKPEIVSAGQLYPLPGTILYKQLTDDQRAALTWPGYAYPEKPGFSINLSAMPDEQFADLYRRFRKYVLRPTLHRHLLRDAPSNDRRERRRLKRKIRSFALRHPIRARRLPV